jgi:hypothetical protein
MPLKKLILDIPGVLNGSSLGGITQAGKSNIPRYR